MCLSAYPIRWRHTRSQCWDSRQRFSWFFHGFVDHAEEASKTQPTQRNKQQRPRSHTESRKCIETQEKNTLSCEKSLTAKSQASCARSKKRDFSPVRTPVTTSLASSQCYSGIYFHVLMLSDPAWCPLHTTLEGFKNGGFILKTQRCLQSTLRRRNLERYLVTSTGHFGLAIKKFLKTLYLHKFIRSDHCQLKSFLRQLFSGS